MKNNSQSGFTIRDGFTIIEVVLYIALSSVLAGALFSSFWQTNRITSQADRLMDVDMRIPIAFGQLQKDLSGAFVPRYAKKEQSGAVKKPVVKPGGKPQGKPKKPAKILKQIFFSQSTEEGQLDQLTFITCNPLQVYGKQTPRIVRVMYQLIPDEKNKGTFVLQRQESQELDMELFREKSPRKYKVIDNIKTGKITFKTPVIKQKQKKSDKSQVKKKVIPEPIEYETQTSWESPQTQDPKKKKNIIPQYITIELELAQTKRSEKFTIIIRVWAYESSLREPQKPKKKVSKTASPFKDAKEIKDMLKGMTKELKKGRNAKR